MSERRRQVNAVNTILCAAEKDIFIATGLRMRLISVGDLPDYGDAATTKPQMMLKVIADALEMDYSAYTDRNRTRRLVRLRQIGCYMLHTYYPDMTQSEIGSLIGPYDHTTVIHCIKAVTNRYESYNQMLISEHEIALEAVTQLIAITE